MKNNMSYEEAVEKLKRLEEYQRHYKRMRWISSKVHGNAYNVSVYETKKEINLLLSIIHAHKAARKLYAENHQLKKVNEKTLFHLQKNARKL